MKIFPALFLCLFFAFTAFGQAFEAADTTKVGIEEIVIMRDDGKGNAGEETRIFKPRDVPIYCRIFLSSVKSAVVKVNLVTVDVKGFKADKKIVTSSYKTNGKQNIVTFTSSPDDIWLAGKYRFDFFVDDELVENREIEITENSQIKTDKKTARTAIRPRKLSESESYPNAFVANLYGRKALFLETALGTYIADVYFVIVNKSNRAKIEQLIRAIAFK